MSYDSQVNFRNDVIFKAVFGNEKNEKILISLLNETLGLNVTVPDKIPSFNMVKIT